MERHELRRVVTGTGAVGQVVDLGQAPAHRQAVDHVVGGRAVEHVDEAGVRVRRIVHDHLRPRRDAARLLHVQRGLVGARCCAEIAAAVDVHLRDPAGIDAEADGVPVRVRVVGIEIRQRRDADRLARAVDVGVVQRIDVVEVRDVADGVLARHAGGRRAARRQHQRPVEERVHRAVRVDVHRVEFRLVAQARDRDQQIPQQDGDPRVVTRPVEVAAVLRVVVQVDREGLIERLGRAGRLDHEVIGVDVGDRDPEARQIVRDRRDVAIAGRVAPDEVADREEMTEPGRVGVLRRRDVGLERRRVAHLEDQGCGHGRARRRRPIVLSLGWRNRCGSQGRVPDRDAHEEAEYPGVITEPARRPEPRSRVVGHIAALQIRGESVSTATAVSITVVKKRAE